MILTKWWRQLREFPRQKPITVSIALILFFGYIVELLAVIVWGVDAVSYWIVFSSNWPPSPAWFLSLFAHESGQHLLINLGALLIYGSLVEKFISTRTYLATYLISGFIGGITHVTLSGSGTGASGAIFGLMGVHFVVFFSDYGIRMWESTEEYLRLILATSVPVVVASQAVIDFFLVDSQNFAHVTGFGVGIIIGIVIVRVGLVRKN